VDEEGEPAVNATVQAFRQQYVNGKKQLAFASQANTNDLGEYRVFGLKPGRYWIAANARVAGAVLEDDAYIVTFFPRTADPAAATPIEAAAGAQVRNIDIALRRRRTVSVRGLATNEAGPAGASAMPCTVVLSPVSTRIGGSSRSAICSPQGNFDIRSVTPGSYTLNAIWSSGQDNLVAKMPVEVSNANIEDLRITVRNGVPVTGKVRVDGDAPADWKKLSVVFPPLDPQGIQFGRPPSPISEDGTFQAEGVRPDHYRVIVSNLPEDWYVKSIRSGQTDVLLDGLEVAGSTPPAIELVISPRAAQATGVVIGGKSQKPVPGATVVLVPQEKTRSARSEYYKSALTGASGRFTITGIPPGDYRVYVFDDVENGAWMDPEFLKDYEGEKLTLEDSARANLQLKLDIVE
jgi:hypothetical protein